MKRPVTNPNSSQDFSRLVRAEAERVDAGGTDVLMRTAPYGVEQSELLVALGCGSHRAGSLACPPVKPNVGLSAEITRVLAPREELR